MHIDLHQQYLDTGVIFVPQLLTPERVARLRVIAEHCLSQWRVRSAETGKAAIDEPWAVAMRHLNHPGYFEGRRAWLQEMLETVADPRVLDVVREVFDDEPIFRCTSLFMNPLDASLDGDWHRDSQFVTKTEADDRAMVEAEAARLRSGGPVGGIQLQIALVPSEDVEYVPGSHVRWDTPEEYAIRRADGMKHNRSNLMPGAVRYHQSPGDAAAFHAHGHHRGRYHADKCRRTLMLTYNALKAARVEDYFSDQPWCLQPDYLDGLSSGARQFFERFIREYSPFWERQIRAHG